MIDGRMTVRFSTDEMATICRLSAALNMPKSSIVKLAIAKLAEGNSGSDTDIKFNELSRSLLRSLRLLWFAREVKDREKLEQVEAQLLEIWKHVY